MPTLNEEFERLNDEQKDAVRDTECAVVLAGPGSGKTATLVLKVAHLLNEHVKSPQGLACVTYNREAAKEFRNRLLALGVRSSRYRPFLGTVHSFCLNCILRPFADTPRSGSPLAVATDKTTDGAVQRALDSEGIQQRVGAFRPALTKIRRYLACGESVDGFEDREVRAAKFYEALLNKAEVVDFEGIVLHSLKLIREDAVVRDILAARFPWLVIDEYQDLGGPLHQIVVALRDMAAVNIFAVGDPNQSIYPFTGADPKYLRSLARRDDFMRIHLKFNYRSGSRLIHAAQAALALPVPQDYRPDPTRSDPGEVFINEVHGGLEQQIDAIAKMIIPDLAKNGVPLHEIAVLYKQKGQVLTAILESLRKAQIPFVAERDEQMPRGPIVRWLQACASWCVGEAVESNHSFGELAHEYRDLCESAGVVDHGDADLLAAKRLYGAIERLCEADTLLSKWLASIDEAINLSELLKRSQNRAEDVDDLDALVAATNPAEQLATLTLADFAREGRVRGKLVVTTYHSSKGRQFDAVILPALQEGILPFRRRDKWSGIFSDPTESGLADDRRLFYVGFTRARNFVFLLHSPVFHNDYGQLLPAGPSRFVNEIQHRLATP